MAGEKRKGTEREHDVRKLLNEDGWVVYRGAASLGCADLIAMKDGRIMLIQVKANRAGGPYANFRRPERAMLHAEADRAGATATLAHWPHGRGGILAWHDASEWPR